MFRKIFFDLMQLRKLSIVSIDLMLRDAMKNNAFYEKITRSFYQSSRKRHRKFPLIGVLTHGVALCELPETSDEYFMLIEAAGRRNVKKANRNGYEYKRINFNEYLEDIATIRRSTDQRQGQLSEAFMSRDVKRCENPESLSPIHDYPYFGVLKDGKLYAYMGVLVAGELAIIEHIYGHSDFQNDGIVPKLIVDTVEYLIKYHSGVKWYGYGSYFGASETLRRFKRKFRFLPYRVRWSLGA